MYGKFILRHSCGSIYKKTCEKQLFITFISVTFKKTLGISGEKRALHKALSTNSLKPIAALQNSLGSLSVHHPLFFLEHKLSSSLTSEKAEQDLFEHCLVDLRVGDGVQQLPLLLIGEDELTQLLPVDFPVLEEDLRPKVVDDSGIGRRVGLHNCSRGKAEICGIFHYTIGLIIKIMCQIKEVL